MRRCRRGEYLRLRTVLSSVHKGTMFISIVLHTSIKLVLIILEENIRICCVFFEEEMNYHHHLQSYFLILLGIEIRD